MLPRSTARLVSAISSKPRSGGRLLHTSTEVGRGFPLRRALGITKKRTKAQRDAELNGWKKELSDANEQAKASGLKTDWVLKTAVIIERPEILAAEPPAWKAEYDAWKTKWEEPIQKQKPDIMSYFKASEEAEAKASSNANARAEAAKDPKKKAGGDKKGGAEQAAPAAEEAVDTEAAERKKRADQLRAEAQEAEQELYGPRITEADKKNDRKSLRRKLDRKLFLVIKKKGADSWQFPDSAYKEGADASMRQVAERAVSTAFADSIDRYFVGNAPIGVTTAPYNAEAQKKLNTYGDKVFFYYAYYIKGTPAVSDSSVVDHAWVTKDELPEYLDAKSVEYLSRVLPMEGMF